MIRPAIANDADAIARIYNHYIVNTTITFEEQPVSAQQMAERIGDAQSASLPWLVAEQAGELVGYAYASKWRVRSAYRFSVETTVYLQSGAAGQGLGSLLYQALFAALKERGVHVIIGGIALPNPGSVALHEKCGLKKVAHFEEVGFKFGKWVDVGYWQMTL
ncbi:MAG: arsinothricin resistance N-acetyltransferase ArsN1 family B [Rhizobacter sp.]